MFLLFFLALAIVANGQVLKVTNGQVIGDIYTGKLLPVSTAIVTAVNQPALVWPASDSVNPGGAFLIQGFANQTGLQYNIQETFVSLTGTATTVSYPGTGTSFGTGPTTIYVKVVPAGQPAGRYDFTVTVTDGQGNPVKDTGISLQELPTTFSVTVGFVPAGFVKPNLDVRINSVEVLTENSPLAIQINGVCRTGAPVNVFIGLPPNQGTLTSANCLDGQHITLPLPDISSSSPLRQVVLVDYDGLASASKQFVVPSQQ